jgi:3-methyladenine DNA glycosylase AlkD
MHKNIDLDEIKLNLKNCITISQENVKRFFKVGCGDYGEQDKFLGVRVPDLRNIAKKFYHLDLDSLQILINSPFNEERLLAIFIMVKNYSKYPKDVYDFYVSNIDRINNWNLVDSSAHLIIGRHLFNQSKDFLFELSNSEKWWRRRISIIATWFFIKNKNLDYTFEIAQKLLCDEHDLIQKAVGWMLREAGKINQDLLVEFLSHNNTKMPRIMLSYSMEKLSNDIKMFIKNQ